MHNLVPDFILEQYAQQNYHGKAQVIALFVDVSGFTATTEALMKHGTESAEILADTMHAIFNPLVESVYDHGGFIAGFAGDALTALFPCGADYQSTLRDAITAAWTIKQSILVHPSQATRYGTFNFAVKLGLADGDAEWGILSSSDQHRNAYYFKGAAIDDCAHAEHHANGGDLIITANVQHALESIITTEPIGDYFRVTKFGVHVSTRSEHAKSRTTNVQAFFPTDLLQSTVRGEFRQVVSVFINLQGNPSRNDLVAFAAPFFRLLAQYDGYLCRIDFGDKGCRLLLFWGAPNTHEDDLTRALDFVLALQRAVPNIGLRAGVTYALAYAGFAGAISREEYTCYSSRVNMAARLVASTTWAEVWLDEPTARFASKQFVVESIGAYPFKGFADKQNVIAVRARKTNASESYRYRLIGRQRELAQLRQFIAPIFDHRFAGALTVFGEAGIGKSRLLHEFRNRPLPLEGEVTVAKYATVRGEGWFLCPTDQILRESLNPFRYFLRHYFDQTDNVDRQARFDAKLNALIARTPAAALQAELERARSFLAALVDLTWVGSLYEQLDPKSRYDNIADALKTLLKAEALCQPVVIQIEDAHWLDTDSIEFLRRLTRNLADYPIALILTSRDAPSQDWFAPGTPQFSLDPGSLSRDDTQSFAQDILDGPVAPSLVDFLLQRTNGNPFFVEQILLFMLEQKLVCDSVDGFAPCDDSILVPSDVRAVLTARLDRLSQDVRAVVQTAAVLGREFEIAILSQMLRDGARVPLNVQQAEQKAVWSALTEMRYIFKHALLRDAAYDMQLRARLRELHTLAARAIEQICAANLSPHYTDLAFHFGVAEETERERYYALLAGKQAAAQFANASAVRYLSRALELTPTENSRERYEILQAREQVYDLQGARALQAQDIDAMLTLADRLGDPQSRAQALLRRAHHSQATGNISIVITVATTALAIAQATQLNELQTTALVRIGDALRRQSNYESAREHLERALSIAPSPNLQAASRLSLGNVTFNRGDYAAARDHFDQALQLYRATKNRQGASQALNNLGVAAVWQGDLTAGRTYYEQAYRSKHEIGDRRGESSSLNNLGQVLRMQAEYEQAQACHLQALRICDEIDNREVRGLALGDLGRLMIVLGDWAQARAYLEESLAVRRAIGNRHDESATLAMLALLHHQTGEQSLALDYSTQAIELARVVNARPMEGFGWTYLGHARFALQQYEQAAEAYRQAIAIRCESNEEHMTIEATAYLAQALNAHGDASQAIELIEQVIEYLKTKSLDGTSDPLRAKWACVQLLRAHNDPRAQTILESTRAQLIAQANKIGDERLRKSFLDNVPAHREIMNAWGTDDVP